MTETYHTETFTNIPQEKQERILRTAAEILGRDGINGIRMGDIAKAAGISHGSLFSYFPTKDHLVRAVLARGATMEKEHFSGAESNDFATGLDTVLSKAWDTASNESGLISLWLSLSLRENARFAEDILPMERDATLRWVKLLDLGLRNGAIENTIDPRVLVFLLDAAVAQLMKSQASELEREKFELIFPDVDDPASLIAKELTKLLKRH